VQQEQNKRKPIAANPILNARLPFQDYSSKHKQQHIIVLFLFCFALDRHKLKEQETNPQRAEKSRKACPKIVLAKKKRKKRKIVFILLIGAKFDGILFFFFRNKSE
jgi:hypothetical protein